MLSDLRGLREAAMTTLHVVPDERGNWRIFEDARPAALSEHQTATDAELSAWSHLRARGAQEILVHDRYGRTRRPVRYDRPGRRGHASRRSSSPT
jgi:hypothetical protein